MRRRKILFLFLFLFDFDEDFWFPLLVNIGIAGIYDDVEDKPHVTLV